jgi:hypothetical protein
MAAKEKVTLTYTQLAEIREGISALEILQCDHGVTARASRIELSCGRIVTVRWVGNDAQFVVDV